jgi:hypothetical protein
MPGRVVVHKGETTMTTTITTTTTATLQRSRTLTGLKPTGRLQLGNLLGAIRPMVQAQESSEIHCDDRRSTRAHR